MKSVIVAETQPLINVLKIILAGEFILLEYIERVKPDVKNSQPNHIIKDPTITRALLLGSNLCLALASISFISS